MKKYILLSMLAFSTSAVSGDFKITDSCNSNHVRPQAMRNNNAVAGFSLCNRGNYEIERVRFKLYDSDGSEVININKWIDIPQGQEITYYLQKDDVISMFGENYDSKDYHVRMTGNIKLGNKRSCRVDLSFPDQGGVTGVRFKMSGSTTRKNKCKTRSISQG